MKKLLTFAFLALAAIPVYAAEEAPLSPFAGNLGNAIWTLGIFVIVVLVLGKFAWGPVLSLLQERERFIHKSLSDAKHDRDEAEARLKDYANKLQSAQAEAVAIIEEARRDAERLREDLRERAKSEADTMVKNAERQIELQTTRGPADPSGSRRSVGHDRLEAARAQYHEGRQREAHRGHAETD